MAADDDRLRKISDELRERKAAGTLTQSEFDRLVREAYDAAADQPRMAQWVFRYSPTRVQYVLT